MEGPCRMVGSCPAFDLPRVGPELDRAGWASLRSVAQSGVVGVREEGGRVFVDEDCRLPGGYVELARAPESPGSGWSATRLVFVPEEVSDCPRATHAIASFAVPDGGGVGEAIALPLPCRGEVCFEPGDEAERNARARERFEKVPAAIESGRNAEVLLDLFALAAVVPGLPTYSNLATGLRFIDAENVGGCFVVSEAEHAATRFDPSVSAEDVGAPELSHEARGCRARPSFSTCFPELFVGGEGGNCW